MTDGSATRHPGNLLKPGIGRPRKKEKVKDVGWWRRQAEQWLSSEQEGLDEAADEAFARLFAALPAGRPSDAFVQRAVDAAWLARARRRRIVALTALAASVGLAVASGTVAYVVFGAAGGWLLTTATAVASGSVISTLTTAIAAVEWWSVAARAGSTVARLVSRPQAVAALAATELVGAAALYMLHRLLRSDVCVRSPRAFCF